MSDILKIDTGSVLEPLIEPLPLYSDELPMLSEMMPEYTKSLPNAQMSKLIRQLKMTMKQFGGVGLSANQCNVRERVFILGYEDNVFVCINPKVISSSEELKKDNEGCLSYPGLYLKIDRPIWIDVEFLNENGKLISSRFEGLTARCFLHELDHMNGVRFVQHVGPLTLKMAKQRQEKRLKKMMKKRK